MDKLYWIACDEGDQVLFEGRFLGRTRGAAIKHLKDKLNRDSLTGLVFSITEIPVPLIREIVAEILGQTGANFPEIRGAIPNPPTELTDIPNQEPEKEEPLPEPGLLGNPQPRPEYDWDAAKAYYLEGRGPADVARKMNIPLNTLKGRIRREGWAHERREVDA
ncbi:MAG: hypothetical protein ACP5I4_09490 [Oceanipulchritudo sp.]